MTISRRTLLRLGSGALVTAMGFGAKQAAVAAPAILGLRELDARTLSFDCYYTGEHIKNVTFWADGRYIDEALDEINRRLRDWRADEVHPIDVKLLDLLHRLGRSLETDCHFELVSGYRSPKTNAMLHRNDPGVAVNSLHMLGQAVDISLPGRPLRKVHETALALELGGVGYYPESNFVHVDTGRVRRWLG
jgi:uncharacterized protein YcbK (DUF882 family)